MKVNPTTVQALAHAAQLLRYANKNQEVKQMEEHLRQEKLRLLRLEIPIPLDLSKGRNVDSLA